MNQIICDNKNWLENSSAGGRLMSAIAELRDRVFTRRPVLRQTIDLTATYRQP